VAGLEPAGPYLGGFGWKRTYKTIETGFVGFVGATSAGSAEIHAGPVDLGAAILPLNLGGNRQTRTHKTYKTPADIPARPFKMCSRRFGRTSAQLRRGCL
jgi:hypothetical protein